MSVIQLLALLLALSVSAHIGCAAALIAWRAEVGPYKALLVGASSAGAICGLYLRAVAVYH